MRARVSDWQIYDERGQRKYLSAGERLRFLDKSSTLPQEVRALCTLLALTGCRVSEALTLERHQVDTERSVVTFKTLKRRKLVFRNVPIPPELCTELATLPSDNDRLWNMHRCTAWRWIRRLTDELDIDGPMACPRGLRHGFGIHAATCNVPPNLIQRWMGHSSISTTAVYLDAVGAEEAGFASRMW